MKKEIREWIIAIGIAIILLVIIRTFLFMTYSVSGDSMDPTLKDNDKVIVSKISKTMNHISRGDIIVFHANEKKDYVKRLIGLPGDEVIYKNDKLYINGKFIEESYLEYNKENKSTDLLTENFVVSDLVNSGGKKKLPKDRYLVLGDNREVSLDSRRELGLITKEQFVGKVVFRFYPLSNVNLDFYPDSYNIINK